MRRDAPGDPISRRIVCLLHDNPEVDREYDSLDLRLMEPDMRFVVLSEIEERLRLFECWHPETKRERDSA